MMWPLTTNTDATTRPADEATLTCEPAADGDAEDGPPPDARVEGDERTPEEAGYGYGV